MMEKEKIKVLCHSHEGFNDIMRMNDWYSYAGNGVATISICSPNDDDPVHWFKNYSRNLNLDFDDFDPSEYWNDDIDYNTIFDQFLKDGVGPRNDDIFMFSDQDTPTGFLKAMDIHDSIRLVRFINNSILAGVNTFYIHCSAGLSRSQGVVRYILDTYGDMFDIETNPDNPCLTPNYHVVRMLKRTDRSCLNPYTYYMR